MSEDVDVEASSDDIIALFVGYATERAGGGGTAALRVDAPVATLSNLLIRNSEAPGVEVRQAEVQIRDSRVDSTQSGAGIVVDAGHLYTVGNSDDKDTVFCLDAESGEQKWAVSYPCELDTRQFAGCLML